MSSTKTPSFLAGPAGPALLALALGLGAPTAAAAAAPTVVTVGMTNEPDGAQVMRLDRGEVPPGRVTFKVRNDSRDTVHEFLLVPSALTPDRLPLTKAGDRVDEKRLKGIKELGDLKPGKSGALTVDLKPGHYVVFCNQPGHFAHGMHAELTVAG
jgi:uncharacterized cupredoxin-like copper-binding protein